MDNCLMEGLRNGNANLTLGELRKRCEKESAKAPDKAMVKSLSGERVLRRLTLERYTRDNPFALLPHRPNYLMPVSIVDNASSAEDDARRANLDSLETQFQISLKVAIWDEIFGSRTYLSGAYTGRNFWQSYNSDNSAPFRETNHEPELMLTIDSDREFLGFRNPANRLIFNHQSNGRAADTSRSWNRIIAEIMLERDNWIMSFRPWYRLPEARSKDDNHDIERFYGHFEWHNTFALGRGRSLHAMVRNNLRSDNKGAVELNYSFPISNKINGLIRYFNGYGQSLIDYNQSVEAVGLGVQISEWY